MVTVMAGQVRLVMNCGQSLSAINIVVMAALVFIATVRFRRHVQNWIRPM
ncbi:Uncharacterised protein [Vibrio cholerae]|nr:Uncharacterised protein [Vibrio cholerae]CSC95058.1 Uncharacterised protein [Vibrio cholerae]CSC96042.1 Uncharacterised protein [Vibrio cholerae]CSI67177.1 Uncharacterised protein [Vibrio cholerae]CSI80819.1 Uncharacterised protein [Vibrio cholerae]